MKKCKGCGCPITDPRKVCYHSRLCRGRYQTRLWRARNPEEARRQNREAQARFKAKKKAARAAQGVGDA